MPSAASTAEPGAATVLANATVVHPDRLGDRECVFVRGEVIDYVGPWRPPPASSRVVDLDQAYLLPGLVDLHAHGALGHTFNDADHRVWQLVLDAHLAAGTTSVLATLASDTPQRLRAALAASRTVADSVLAGVHLEGPYLSEPYRGAHPVEALRHPSDGSWSEIDGSGRSALVTLAPELPGAPALIAELTARGVLVAAGHSGADAETMDAAVQAGLSHVAHLWSGQSALVRHGPRRRPGLLEYTLASSGLTAEAIADGHHLPAELVRIAYRCLGPDRLCLVSDASAGTGLELGESFSMGAVRGLVGDGVALAADGLSFCGSVSYLSDILRYAVRQAGIPLVEAVRMATGTPARVLGRAERIGTLAAGRPADLLVVDRLLVPRRVMKAGRWQPVHPASSLPSEQRA